jgi:hypothetical protein
MNIGKNRKSGSPTRRLGDGLDTQGSLRDAAPSLWLILFMTTHGMALEPPDGPVRRYARCIAPRRTQVLHRPIPIPWRSWRPRCKLSPIRPSCLPGQSHEAKAAFSGCWKAISCGHHVVPSEGHETSRRGRQLEDNLNGSHTGRPSTSSSRDLAVRMKRRGSSNAMVRLFVSQHGDTQRRTNTLS